MPGTSSRLTPTTAREPLGRRSLLAPDTPIRHSAQATTHQAGDAGGDLPRRAPDRTWPAIDPRAGWQRPHGQSVGAAARRVVRPHRVHAAQPGPGPAARGIRKSRSARVAAWATRGALSARTRIGALTSGEERLRKPRGGEIDVGLDRLAIKLRFEIGRKGR